MYFYIIGKVVFLATDFIAVLVNDIAYQIYVPYPNSFLINETYTIYIYQVIKEDKHYLIGFKDLIDKEMFTSLISVSGVGPKTALTILKETNNKELVDAINNEDIYFFKNITGIGNKVASQIILDLKGKLASNVNNDKVIQVKKTLKNLGFTNKEINEAISNIKDFSISNENILKEALRNLRK